MSDPLANGGYPALAQAASRASRSGQRRFFAALKIRLSGLAVGGVGGGILLGLQLHVVGGAVALAGFTAALVAELYTAIDQPDRRWYKGRAAAESVKALAWRYAVHGESFEGKLSKIDAEERLIAQVREVLDDLGDLDLESSTAAGVQISPAMYNMRAADFTDRKHAYCTGRVENQRVWYVHKAEHNRARKHIWTIGILVAEGVGVLGGVLTIAGVTPIDPLALMAILIAAATAWTQARQYSPLATAYGIAAQELATVSSEAEWATERTWAEFVSRAEDAISREHALWRASRGLPAPRSRD